MAHSSPSAIGLIAHARCYAPNVGMQYSWVAVGHASIGDVVAALKLKTTNEHSSTPPIGYSRYRGTACPDWSIVIAFGSDWSILLQPKQAQRLSELGETYWVSRHDVHNYGDVAYFRQGEIVWRANYISGNDSSIRRAGAVPPYVRSEFKAASELASEEDYEASGFLQGVPEATVGAIIGFDLSQHFHFDSEEDHERAEREGPFGLLHFALRD